MAPLEWDRCYQLAIQTFAAAVGAIAFSRTLQRGGSMTWESAAFLGVGVALMAACLVLTVLFVLRSPGPKGWRYGKAALAAAIVVAVTLIGIYFYRYLTEIWQGVLLGTSAVFLLEGLRRSAVGYWRRRPRRAPNPSEAAPSAAPKAARESADQLRSIYALTADVATNLAGLAGDFLQTARPGDSAKLVADLLRKYPVEDLQAENMRVRSLLQSESANSSDALVALANRYEILAGFVKSAGQAFLQDRFFSHARYSEWHRRHEDLRQALRRLEVFSQTAEKILAHYPNLPDPMPRPTTEAIDYFHKVYKEWLVAFGAVRAHISGDLCNSISPPLNRVILDYVLPAHAKNATELADTLPNHHSTQSEFTVNVQQFRSALLDYSRLLMLAKRTGEMIFGEPPYSKTNSYQKLSRGHAAIMRTLRAASEREPFRHVLTERFIDELAAALSEKEDTD